MLVSLFKVLWNIIFIKYFYKLIKITTKSNIKAGISYYLMNLTSFIISPIIATIISNQSCFYSIFHSNESITSTVLLIGTTNSVNEQTSYFGSVSFNPPFLYSYNFGQFY